MDAFIERDCLEYLEKIDLSPLYGKTVFVAGANGLIGTYIIYMLHLANVRKNAQIGIVALSRSPACEKLRDIFADRYVFYPVDLADPKNFVFPEKADYIVHGATYAQPQKFMKNYADTIHLNTVTTELLLEKAKRDGAKLLFLSSSEVYGEPDAAHIPTREDYPGLCTTLSVRSVYSESKRMGETLCFAYRFFEGVDAKIARISMSYGPGVNTGDERVMANFMKEALEDRRIVMLDDGSKVRTFCYIADCVLMLLNVLTYGKELVYNVGGCESVTVRQLAEAICEITGSTLAGVPAKRADSNVLVSPGVVALDTEKLRTQFRLPPAIPLAEGLRRTIAWNIENAGK